MEDQPSLFEVPASSAPSRAVDRDYAAKPVNGRFFGRGATRTETESGVAAEIADAGPLRRDSAAHKVLRVYVDGASLTAYEASRRAVGDYHLHRRESTRLLSRGFLEKFGVLPNPAPGGGRNVDAYRITSAGRAELARLG